MFWVGFHSGKDSPKNKKAFSKRLNAEWEVGIVRAFFGWIDAENRVTTVFARQASYALS